MKSSLQAWDQFIFDHPDAHLLQSGAWGELKSAFGWKPVRVLGKTSGAQILFRTIPGGFTFGYIPKGPIGENWQEIFPEIDVICREERAIFLKVEPDLWSEDERLVPFAEKGWKHTRPIQPRRTIIIPITGDEQQIMAEMKQKTRYNIHLAEKKGIEVKVGDDLSAFQKMMIVTGKRDRIGVHAQAYYQRAYDLFHDQGKCDLLFAYYQGQPIAAIMVFAQGKTAWYMYGASTGLERNRMPTYLLQWEAIRWAKAHNCVQYDLWGIPDLEEDDLERSFSAKQSHDGLWGVYRFKRGFGGKIMRSVGAWERPYYPSMYLLYLQMIKLRGRQEE